MYVKYTDQIAKRPYEDSGDVRKLVPDTIYKVVKGGEVDDEYVAFLEDFDGPLSADRFEILNIITN